MSALWVASQRLKEKENEVIKLLDIMLFRVERCRVRNAILPSWFNEQCARLHGQFQTLHDELDKKEKDLIGYLQSNVNNELSVCEKFISKSDKLVRKAEKVSKKQWT